LTPLRKAFVCHHQQLGGGDLMASYDYIGRGFQYVLGFNDAHVGDRHLDYCKVGVNFVAAPVPEPSTYALMLAGLGAVGFVARHRKGPPTV
jgi:hypothetical protein